MILAKQQSRFLKQLKMHLWIILKPKLDETLEVFEKLESELGIPDSEFSVQPGDVIGIDRGL